MKCFFGVHDFKPVLNLALMIFVVKMRGGTPMGMHPFYCAECSRCGKRDVKAIYHKAPMELTLRAAQWSQGLEIEDDPFYSMIYIENEDVFEVMIDYATKLDAPPPAGKPNLTLVK